MSHLSPERLAALADEEPTAAELAHLGGCADCAAERDAHRGLVDLASAERASIGLPLTHWESLAPALRAERLIARPAVGLAAISGGRHGRHWLQVAAALLFVAGGTVIGRVTAGAAPLPGLPVATPALMAAASDSQGVAFQSVADARAARDRAQLVYQNASAFLAQNDTAVHGIESPSSMRTRLAALDQVSHAMRQALNDAPYDPVINDYYLTTLGQREATLRQLNTALPAGMRVNSF
ncbi:MAG: hypothetical protein WBQ26_13110 [Gemmatimonadaceae bacterium]|nr:hypothetical protein [Gemmatimonadaceae bacterium]